MTQLWCNGQWLDPPDFSFSPIDRGAILGLGLFETLLALDGCPVFADRHLARLRMGCARLGWDLALPDFHRTAGELLARNHLTTGLARIRLAISAGSGLADDLAQGSDHLVWLTATRVTPDAPVPMRVSLSPWRRNEHSPLAGLKSASYAENLIALDHARKLGFDETIFLNTSDHLCEAAMANLFLVKDGTLQTPSLESGCLPGITREVVIELAQDIGISCEVGDLTEEHLHAADEIFLTSSIRGPVAVSRLDERMISPGPVAGQLRQAIQAAYRPTR